MKTLFLFLFIFANFQAWAVKPANKPVKGKTAAKAERPKLPEVPSLKENEYALFLEGQYTVFTTQKQDELELDASCFKTKPLKCEAYQAKDSKIRVPTNQMEGMTNLAAIHCQEKGGKNYIALDAKKGEYNFCRFKDGSMVNSWSLYFKENPIQVIQ